VSTVLIVDDDEVTCRLLDEVLSGDGIRVIAETDPCAALERASAEPVDLALLDVQMPELDGLTLLARLRARDARLPIVVMTAFGSIDSAVRAISCGAVDYVSKPMSVDEIRATVRRALERPKEEPVALPPDAQEIGDIVGRSPAMVEVYKAIARVAPTSATVLVLGESGTGKELVARALHAHGPRCNARFVAVDCASLGDALLESELFGHVRGAFTGAVGDSPGLFVEADGGTVFLDEIGDVSPAMQARLLRVLQEHQVRPVGGTRWRTVDVRVIAATNRDLAAAVAAGRFREDLYYRLKVVTLALPPLRERADDIPLLVDRLVKRAARTNGKSVSGVSRAALALLQSHSWPGNVRELEHVLERAVVLARGEVLTMDDIALPGQAAHGAPATLAAEPGNGRPTLDQLKRRYVLAVLDECAGNVSRAATTLGIDRRSLHRMLARYRAAERARPGEAVAADRDRGAGPAAEPAPTSFPRRAR
jgi:DNA-binding NtrC family response regulator